ncbi:MAG: family 10 glycosylhydrolase [Symploca sp. SIO2E9]|nr:family 10 glycosylhydrolase [Symploca sp. SIO2E9]
MKNILTKSYTAFANGLVALRMTFGRKSQLVSLFIFGVTITLLQTATVAQTKLNDIQGNWAQTCIEQLSQQQIISGYPDGSFGPNQPVTRAEFAAMLNQAFPEAAQVRDDRKFADVPSTYWASEAISKAYQRGFLSGYPGGVFRPKQNIPRVQALVSLANGLNYTPIGPSWETLEQAFADAQAIPEYAQSAIAAALENQLVVNYPKVGTLNPNNQASRAEIAAFLCQATQGTGLVAAEYIQELEIPTDLTAELRGVWLTNIDSELLFSLEALAAALNKLKELNFNTIYPTVWNWGYTLHPSEIAQRETGRQARISTPLEKDLFDPERGLKEGRDVLQEVIEISHQGGMRVIPWFEFGFKAPSYSQLAQRHPDWLTQTREGNKTQIPEGLTPEEQKLHEIVWLNPFKPEVQQFIEDLIIEVVSNYDIDGIQLDDHFGLPSKFGYDPFTVELYKQEHQGKFPPNDPQAPEWLRWRANKITDFLKKLFRAVKERKPDVIISISPNPQRFSYNSFLADWEQWERQGLVEELIVQIYRDNLSTFVGELEQPELKAARTHIPVGIGILSGLKNRAIPFSQIQRQVEAVRRRGFAGVSFFFYETLWNISDQSWQQRQAAFGELFPKPAQAPDLSQDWQPSS